MKTGRMFRRIISMAKIFVASLFIISFSGCGQNNVSLDKTAFVTDLTKLSVPDHIQVVGLGEASHGTSEYQQLKGKVFEALVENNGCRVFAIEGDFGGCAKVNEYIHGGSGTAQEAVAKIGFRIYRTQEMADIVEWMRSYNENAPAGIDLRIYGFDAQRYDNNKELLFEYLKTDMPHLTQSYASKLSLLTDENMYSLNKSTLEQAVSDISALMSEMEEQKPSVLNVSEQLNYDLALEYARCILENTRLQGENSGYNKMRDALMSKKVEWIAQHEDGLIFINGHNGHIGKQSLSGYVCMGQLLDAQYGEAYFAIGTESSVTRFNAQDGDIYKQFNVANKNTLTEQLNEMDENFYYLAFENVFQDEPWQKVLSTRQRMTALNVNFSSWQKVVRSFYTLTLTPYKSYDGIIVVKNTEPTHLLDR